MNNWAVLFTEREHSTVKSFLYTFANCTNRLGMSVQQPMLIKVMGDRTENYIHKLNDTVKHITDLQLVVIIVSNQRQDRYDAIKRICCLTLGIPSQVIEYFSIHIVISILYKIVFLGCIVKNFVG